MAEENDEQKPTCLIVSFKTQLLRHNTILFFKKCLFYFIFGWEIGFCEYCGRVNRILTTVARARGDEATVLAP